jgi:hypothetical protein
MGLLGLAPNQVPTNADLGTMAYQDSAYVAIGTLVNSNNISSNTFTENTYPVASQKDVGTKPNQIPLNQYLGRMAYQDYAETIEQNLQIDTNTTAVQPTLLLDFTNTGKLDSRVNFARSNTAYYYDSYTSAVAEQNLLLQSQTFDNVSWNKSNSTATADTTTAPDGTTTADSVIPTANLQGHRILQTVTVAGTWAFSFYVKANGYTKIGMWDSTVSGAYAAFNLSTGTVLDSGAGASSATITALTNSWYRVSFVATSSGAINFSILVLDPAYTSGGINNSWLPDGTSGVYLWGAQLEQRGSVTAYNATTTSALINYIPALQIAPVNTPRFNFNPVTRDSLGLLIEPGSTNLLTYSQDFSNSGWTKSNTTIITGATIAPDGTQTANLMVPDATSSAHYVDRIGTAVTSTQTISCYAKYGGYRYLQIIAASSDQQYANFDLLNGIVTASGTAVSSSLMTPAGNGWYRCSITVATGVTTLTRFYVVPSPTSVWTASGLTGNGYSGIYIWGAQLETIAVATSYIPTTSTTLSRASDNVTITGTNFSSWFSQSQGTFYAEFNLANPGLPFTVLDNSNGPSGRYIYGNSYGVTWYDGKTVGSYLTVQPNVYYKVAISSTLTTATGTGNGGIPSTTSASGNFVIATSLTIGNDGNYWQNGHIKKLVYYPTNLSSFELQEITS